MSRDEALKMLQASKLMLLGKDNRPVSDLYYAISEGIDAISQVELIKEIINDPLLNTTSFSALEEIKDILGGLYE